jgi:hypothetical protein
MRKQKGIATPSITRFILWDKNYFFRITRELKEYLQSKLPRGDEGLYCCSSPDPTEWSRCWEKSRRFCKKKSLDFDAFMEIFEKTVDLFNCESEIANDLKLDKLAHDLGIFSKGESGEDQERGKDGKVASPDLTGELLQEMDLVREYVEYLRSRVKRNRDGSYYCETPEKGYRCWDQTEQFCREKGLDADTVICAFTVDFGCESNVANSFDGDAFCNTIKELKEKGYRNI